MPQLSEAKVVAYLQHLEIGYVLNEDQVLPEPTYALLEQLQLKHYYKKPFETLTIHLPNPLSLADNETVPFKAGIGGINIDPDALFDKIVNQGRGGYCFELNGLFSIVLRSLGYNITPVLARVSEYFNKDPAVEGYSWKALSHQCTLVQFDAGTTPDRIEGASFVRYHVDVGFGAGQPSRPLLLDAHDDMRNKPYLLRRERLPPYSAVDRSVPEGYTLLKRMDDAFWSPLYHFADQTVQPSDYTMANYMSNTHPQAIFVNTFVCSLPLVGGGRNSISWTGEDGQMKFTSKATQSASKVERNIKTIGELRNVLEKYFHILL